jgi:hypothetical protein
MRSAVTRPGAAIGSSIGKLVAGDRRLFLFALAMIAVSIAMLSARGGARSFWRRRPGLRLEMKSHHLVVDNGH